MHGARLLELGSQFRRKRRAFSPQFARDDRRAGFAEPLSQSPVSPLVCAREQRGRTPHRRGVGSQQRSALETPVESAFGLQRAFARLAGIARLVERLQPPAHENARSGRRRVATHVGQHARAPVERERHLRRAVTGTEPTQERRAVARGAAFRNGARMPAQVGINRSRDQGGRE